MRSSPPSAADHVRPLIPEAASDPPRIVLATNYAYEELHAGALDYFRQRDWLLDATTVIFPGHLPPPEGCAGILAGVTQESLRAWVIACKCPVVHLLHSPLAISHWPMVVCDREAIGRCGAQHFLELGSTHFAYYRLFNTPNSNECHAGFVREMKAHGQTVHELDFHAVAEARQITISRAQRVKWLITQLRPLPLPLAVMAGADNLAVDLALAARGLGLRIPEDLAILGAEDQPLVRGVVREEISSVDVNLREIGRLGSELLVRLIESAKPGSKEVPMLVKVPPKRVVVRQSTATFTCDHPGVTAAAIFVRRHFHEPIAVKDVAVRAGMSVRSLQTEYPSRVGCTVKDDIQRARLKRAERLLETTDLKLAAVASESGFKNPEYLCAVFQAKHQVTPQTWRLRHSQG